MNDNKKPSYKFEILKLLILGFKDASHPSFVSNFNCGQKNLVWGNVSCLKMLGPIGSAVLTLFDTNKQTPTYRHPS